MKLNTFSNVSFIKTLEGAVNALDAHWLKEFPELDAELKEIYAAYPAALLQKKDLTLLRKMKLA